MLGGIWPVDTARETPLRKKSMFNKTKTPKLTDKPLSYELLRKMDAYWRAANYLPVGQIYLYDNPLLKKPLKLEHIKLRLLGHWGTTPGLNFVYVHLNRIIRQYDLNVNDVTGPGHGGPALVANIYSYAGNPQFAMEGFCLMTTAAWPKTLYASWFWAASIKSTHDRAWIERRLMQVREALEAEPALYPGQQQA
jgi:hypothetical protein